MDQLRLFGVEPEEPTRPAWRGFSLDTTEAAAIAAFVERYGIPPATVRRVPGALLVGPVPVGYVDFAGRVT